MGSQLTKNYEVERDPKSEGGIGGPWKIYSATRRDREKTPVSIFTFDKRTLDKKPDKDQTINRLKQEITSLIKLRHPNILQVLEPMLEDKTTIAWVTEPIEYCLGDLLRRPHILSTCLGDTESRLGLLDIIQGLSFVHSEARLVHLAVCPDNIYISQGSKWKLGGLNFASNYTVDNPAKLDSNIDVIASAKAFRYQVEIEKMAPLLHFTAPEVVSKQGGTPAADIFSLGCTTYAIYKALSNTSSDLLLLGIEDFTIAGHRTACINALKPGNISLKCLPEFLNESVFKMMSLTPSERSSLHELSISRGLQTPYVKTIYYLEHLQEKQDAQKMQFFKGLTSIIDKFDKVIMHKRLLPALVSNMQHPSLTPFILPSILTILKSCDITKDLFQQQIWPSIAKLITGKEIPAQSFYLILSEVDLLIRYTDIEACKKSLLPLVFKGYECGVAQIQTTIMSKTPELLKEIGDPGYIKTQILPRFLQGIINSKASTVKESGLKALSQIYHTFDRGTLVETIIPSLEKFKKFDITGIMIMHLLEIYEGISKVLGHKATAINILPALLPLLVDAELSRPEFDKLFVSIINMMNLIKEMRSGELSDNKEEPAIENLRSEDIEEVNDIFRDIFDVSGKPIMEAPSNNHNNNEIDDIFKTEPTKNEIFKGGDLKKNEGFNNEPIRIEPKIKQFNSDPVQEIKKPNPFTEDFYKQDKPAQSIISNQQKDFKLNKPEAPKANISSGIDDLFTELANKPKEEFKAPAKSTGMTLKPPQQNRGNPLDIKPGSLKPQMKQGNNPIKINTDDFFNEFLPSSNKRDPFAGL